MGPSASAARRCIWRKVHLAVDTPGQVVARSVTPADADDRDEVDRLAGAVQGGQTATWRRHLSIRATPAGRPRRLRAPTALPWRGAGRPRPSAASFCYLDGGWWSDPSPGPHAIGAWS